jgi:hypothetical protein
VTRVRMGLLHVLVGLWMESEYIQSACIEHSSWHRASRGDWGRRISKGDCDGTLMGSIIGVIVMAEGEIAW